MAPTVTELGFIRLVHQVGSVVCCPDSLWDACWALQRTSVSSSDCEVWSLFHLYSTLVPLFLAVSSYRQLKPYDVY